MNIKYIKISVIVPVYKAEPYLCQCIDSIITQTYTNLEIILVNDGSPDNCGYICDEYALKDNRIKVIHKLNGGVSDARNVGINIATGDYICLIDSDDWVEHDMIEVLYKILSSNNADMSCCNFYTSYINSNISSDYDNQILIFNSVQAIKQMLLNKHISWSASGKLYKKALFDAIQFPIGVLYSEDAIISFKILTQTNRVVSVNVPKYYYRQRKGSIMHCGYNLKIMAHIDSAEKILIALQNNYQNIIELGNAGLLKANLNVLTQLVFSTAYTKIPEYKQIITLLRENCIFILKSGVFTRNEKIKIAAIKININLYKFLQLLSNRKKSKMLFN